ncbi:DoxX family protein [Polaribacter sp.]|jgi:hypothetical protein|uniref:DoxX family protein n=1 Tax=Polaribacter sp. TaxID=1920175 RepID=UPI0007150BC7|nr:MAG: hypothetical protein ABS28_01295 [Cryomorphaceae bacterium BACL22 MAG-120619-bin32]
MAFYTMGVFVSSISFLGYGISYFKGPHMKSEFKRFQLEKLGLLTIILQLIGALGLLLGFWFYTPLLLISAAGLSLMMLLGLVIRFKLKDSLWVSLPALFFMLLNAYIFWIGMSMC